LGYCRGEELLNISTAIVRGAICCVAGGREFKKHVPTLMALVADLRTPTLHLPFPPTYPTNPSESKTDGHFAKKNPIGPSDRIL
jgi:hypothetical protein